MRICVLFCVWDLTKIGSKIKITNWKQNPASNLFLVTKKFRSNKSEMTIKEVQGLFWCSQSKISQKTLFINNQKQKKNGNANAVVVERTLQFVLQWCERMTQWAMSNSRAFHESILKGKDSLLSRSTSLRFFRLEVTVECCQLFVHPDRLCQLVKLRNPSHAFISTLWFKRPSWTKSLPSLFCFVCAKVNKWQQWKFLCETCNNNSQNCFPSQWHPVVFVAFSTVSTKINLELLCNRIQKKCCMILFEFQMWTQLNSNSIVFWILFCWVFRCWVSCVWFICGDRFLFVRYFEIWHQSNCAFQIHPKFRFQFPERSQMKIVPSNTTQTCQRHLLSITRSLLLSILGFTSLCQPSEKHVNFCVNHLNCNLHCSFHCDVRESCSFWVFAVFDKDEWMCQITSCQSKHSCVKVQTKKKRVPLTPFSLDMSRWFIANWWSTQVTFHNQTLPHPNPIDTSHLRQNHHLLPPTKECANKTDWRRNESAALTKKNVPCKPKRSENLVFVWSTTQQEDMCSQKKNLIWVFSSCVCVVWNHNLNLEFIRNKWLFLCQIWKIISFVVVIVFVFVVILLLLYFVFVIDFYEFVLWIFLNLFCFSHCQDEFFKLFHQRQNWAQRSHIWDFVPWQKTKREENKNKTKLWVRKSVKRKVCVFGTVTLKSHGWNSVTHCFDFHCSFFLVFRFILFLLFCLLLCNFQITFLACDCCCCCFLSFVKILFVLFCAVCLWLCKLLLVVAGCCFVLFGWFLLLLLFCFCFAENETQIQFVLLFATTNPKIKFFQIWLFWQRQHKVKTWNLIVCEKKTKHNQQKKLKWEFVFCFVFEIWQKLGPKSKLQIENKILHQICFWWQKNSDQTSLKWRSKKFKVCFDAHSQKYHKKPSSSAIKNSKKNGNANAVVVERTLQWCERMTQWAMSNSRAFHESILKGKDSLLSRSTSLRIFRLEDTVECCQLFVHPDRLCQLVKLRNPSHAFISTLWLKRPSWTKSLPSLFCFVCAKVNKWQQWKFLCETCNNNSQNCFPSQWHPVVFVAFLTVSIKINLELLWNRIQKKCCMILFEFQMWTQLNSNSIVFWILFCWVFCCWVSCVWFRFVEIDFCLWDILKFDTKAIVHFRFIQNSGFNFQKDLKWKLCLQTQHKRAKDTCCQSLVHFSCRSWVSHHCANHQKNMSTFVSTTWTATCTVLFIVMWESPAHFECLQCLTKMSECAKSHLVNPNTVVWRFKPRKNEFHWHHSRLTCHVGSLQTDDQHRWPSTIKHCHIPIQLTLLIFVKIIISFLPQKSVQTRQTEEETNLQHWQRKTCHASQKEAKIWCLCGPPHNKRTCVHKRKIWFGCFRHVFVLFETTIWIWNSSEINDYFCVKSEKLSLLWLSLCLFLLWFCCCCILFLWLIFTNLFCEFFWICFVFLTVEDEVLQVVSSEAKLSPKESHLRFCSLTKNKERRKQEQNKIVSQKKCQKKSVCVWNSDSQITWLKFSDTLFWFSLQFFLGFSFHFVFVVLFVVVQFSNHFSCLWLLLLLLFEFCENPFCFVLCCLFVIVQIVVGCCWLLFCVVWLIFVVVVVLFLFCWKWNSNSICFVVCNNKPQDKVFSNLTLLTTTT